MYVAPESKVMVALAAVVATSNTTTDKTLPDDEF